MESRTEPESRWGARHFGVDLGAPCGRLARFVDPPLALGTAAASYASVVGALHPVYLAAVCGVWALLTAAARARPERVEIAVAPEGARFYRIFDVQGPNPEFRALDLELDALAREVGPPSLLHALGHVPYWYASRALFDEDQRDAIRKAAAEAAESARSEFVTVDGNPAQTVGASRLRTVEEADDALRAEASPRTIGSVLREHVAGRHVLVVMFVGLGLEAALSELLDVLFPRLDAGLFLWIAFGTTVVLSSIAFFIIVAGEDQPGESSEARRVTLQVGPEAYEVRREGLGNASAGFRGDSWRLLETVRRLNRSRIGPSAAIAASLRPFGSLRSFLIATTNERDRKWLARQLVPETSA